MHRHLKEEVRDADAARQGTRSQSRRSRRSARGGCERDEELEATRKAVQDLPKGLTTVALGVIDSNPQLTAEEKAFQRQAAQGLQQMLRGIVDLGAVAVALNRESERD
ncbi:MAG: hypothetical protein L3K23_00580 [Thermoplasmata archaeon]|nr:hypothetical protein [Thermoplasmata archaeon]